MMRVASDQKDSALAGRTVIQVLRSVHSSMVVATISNAVVATVSSVVATVSSVVDISSAVAAMVSSVVAMVSKAVVISLGTRVRVLVATGSFLVAGVGGRRELLPCSAGGSFGRVVAISSAVAVMV